MKIQLQWQMLKYKIKAWKKRCDRFSDSELLIRTSCIQTFFTFSSRRLFQIGAKGLYTYRRSLLVKQLKISWNGVRMLYFKTYLNAVSIKHFFFVVFTSVLWKYSLEFELHEDENWARIRFRLKIYWLTCQSIHH